MYCAKLTVEQVEVHVEKVLTAINAREEELLSQVSRLATTKLATLTEENEDLEGLRVSM